MKTVANEQVIMYDCDDTLILWSGPGNPEAVPIANPNDGNIDWVVPHRAHIKILKDRKGRGAYNVVWSAGGWAWAQSVVEALGLEAYVDMCMSKPCAYVDDKPCQEWLVDRIYLKPDSKYGT